jgi:hypothetical protein|nr:MAG TPA: hypothetical protein [Caudoviricetes sp.]
MQKIMEYKIIKKPYGYVVVNVTLNTHAHIPTYKGCRILLHLIKKNIEIKDKYLKRAKKRLMNEAER